MWGEWIEIPRVVVIHAGVALSLPVWGEWIEIGTPAVDALTRVVSPRVGRVD